MAMGTDEPAILTRPFLPRGAERRLLPGGLEDPLPAGRWVGQRFDPSHVADIAGTLRREFERPHIGDGIRPEARVAVAVGSRGIVRLAEIVRAVVEEVRRRGAMPFIVPAMGSHGGATAEGQRQILADYGVVESAVGAPVRSSMDTVELGRLPDGTPVYFDRLASEADGIVVVNRIKPHTGFHGPIESGLVKMIAIGLGKHWGAGALHHRGYLTFPQLLSEVARFSLSRMPILFGVAVVENAFGHIAHLETVPSAEIIAREPDLLRLARERMGRILVDRLDLLVVDEIGKNISGIGMDPNITGRFEEPSVSGGMRIQKIVVLRLTPETHGNAYGIGMADVTTQEVLEVIDFAATYTNAATSSILAAARVPVVAPTAQDAVALAYRTLTGVAPGEARVVRIKNTLELHRIWMSERLWEEVSGRPDLTSLSSPEPLVV
jgi:Lactate racemase N-terminal domain